MNAFCNPNREAAGAWDHEAPQESLPPWLQRFYDGLDVWVASPYGLAGPYKLSHGGAQGDSTAPPGAAVPARRVLAIRPPGLDGVCCRRPCALVELPGRS